MNKHTSLKAVTKIFALLLVIFGLVACAQQEEPEEQVYEVPEVQPKYDEEKLLDFQTRRTRGDTQRYENLKIRQTPVLDRPENLPDSMYYATEVNIAYPEEGVKGIYMSVDTVADEDTFWELIDFVIDNGLNSIVFDFKDDTGNITTRLDTDNALIQENTWDALDLQEALKVCEEYGIYPIARIVTFKDNRLSNSRPDLSFHDKETGEVWADTNAAQYVNPFLYEVWEYNVDVAIEAAKIGFQDIQFDYVRFPEGFDVFSEDLEFDKGAYTHYVISEEAKGEDRVVVILDFLKYARERLAPYNVQVSADVFGYTAVAGDSPDVRGIGQHFARMAENVDTISAMIYPSHWGTDFFGITNPDLHPYETIDAYMNSEELALSDLQNDVNSRPWLQDFTDYFSLPPGTFQEYGPDQVQEQIDALFDHGVYEFLLWNAGGTYTPGVDYHPEKTFGIGNRSRPEKDEDEFDPLDSDW